MLTLYSFNLVFVSVQLCVILRISVYVMMIGKYIDMLLYKYLLRWKNDSKQSSYHRAILYMSTTRI